MGNLSQKSSQVKKYKSIFISDIHLGALGSRTSELCAFLKENTSENLYLVGDIIDIWKIKRGARLKQDDVNVIRRVLTAAKRETNVCYVIGNHDEFLRKFLHFGISVGNITFTNETTYRTKDSKEYLVIHGDMFDRLMYKGKWLMHVGDVLYNFMIYANIYLNKVRELFGMEYWSLSKYLKGRTKEALNYITGYEDKLIEYCEKKGYSGVICGHIHTPADRKVRDIHYLNCGDWIDSMTAIVETHSGELKLIEWGKNEKDTDSN